MKEPQYNDDFFMRQALDEAHKAYRLGEIPIGAVVVYGDRVVGRGHNLTETLADPTAHAEMQALSAALGAIEGKYLKNCRLYVTVEPCVMCAGACFWCQLAEVIYGTADLKRGASRHIPSLFHPKTSLRLGIMESECRDLMVQFFQTLRK